MYENGRQINRYENKRNHKRHIKRKFSTGWFCCGSSEASYDGIIRDCENLGWEIPKYWKVYYLSGPRKMAKQQTSRRIRRIYREMLKDGEAYALSNAAYRKTFDYCWTVW